MVFKCIFRLFTPIIVGPGDTQEKKIIRFVLIDEQRPISNTRGNESENNGTRWNEEESQKNKRNDKAPLLSIFDVSKLVVASLSLVSRKMKEGKERKILRSSSLIEEVK